MNQPPSCGRVVHYTLSEVDSPKAAGRVRPAIVIDVVDNTACNLHVMTNGGRDDLSLVHWKGEVQYDESGKPGTWRWPTFVPAKATTPVGTASSFEKEKVVEKPVTDRYHTIADHAAPVTKPELAPAPDGLPFSVGSSEEDESA